MVWLNGLAWMSRIGCLHRSLSISASSRHLSDAIACIQSVCIQSLCVSLGPAPDADILPWCPHHSSQAFAVSLCHRTLHPEEVVPTFCTPIPAHALIAIGINVSGLLKSLALGLGYNSSSSMIDRPYIVRLPSISFGRRILSSCRPAPPLTNSSVRVRVSMDFQ